jgi:predicted RNase H-like HicB family nuclease
LSVRDLVEMNDYRIDIFSSDEDEGYIADIPDLVSCSAFGKTPKEALEEVLLARDAWLAAAREQGKPVPKPRSHPSLHSARF